MSDWCRQVRLVERKAILAVAEEDSREIVAKMCEGATCVFGVWSLPWPEDEEVGETIMFVATRDDVPDPVPMLRFMGIWEPLHRATRGAWRKMSTRAKVEAELELQIQWAKHTFWWRWMHFFHPKITQKWWEEYDPPPSKKFETQPWLYFDFLEKQARAYVRRHDPDLIAMDVTESAR